MTDFFQTRPGRKLIDGTLPRIADALEKIADQLERQAPPVIYPDQHWTKFKEKQKRRAMLNGNIIFIDPHCVIPPSKRDGTLSSPYKSIEDAIIETGSGGPFSIIEDNIV